MRLHGDAQRVMQTVEKIACASASFRFTFRNPSGRSPSLQIAAMNFIGTGSLENQLVRKF
jgi:hypothetical protein